MSRFAPEQADHTGLGNQLRPQFEPLGIQLDGEAAEAGEVAARPRETGDQAVSDRVAGASLLQWQTIAKREG
jgi:hypothetical protein